MLQTRVSLLPTSGVFHGIDVNDNHNLCIVFGSHQYIVQAYGVFNRWLIEIH